MAPSCTVEGARSRSTMPRIEPVAASITATDSGLAERSADAARPDSRGRPRRCPAFVFRSSPSVDEGLGPFQRGVAQRLPVAIVERRLERGREDVAVEDPRVGVVEDGRLDAALQERLGLPHEELVERVLARHEHARGPGCGGRRGPTAGAGSRPCRGSRPRWRSRGGRCRCPARARPSRSRRAAPPRPAAARSRAAARACSRPGTARAARRSRRPDGRSAKRWISSVALRLLAKQIVRRPRETSSASSRAPSPSALARSCSGSSSTGGFQKAIVRVARGRCVVVDHGRVEAQERVRQLARVGDRRRGEEELRVGPVDLRRPAQAPEDVPDVRAEDARGRRAPRRRRRSGGSRARPPSGRDAGGRRRGACPGWSGSRSPTCGSASGARARCRRRRWPA